MNALIDPVPELERTFCSTKIVWSGWPTDFHKFIRDSIDWNSSPGYPLKTRYPTNREVFGFNGVSCDATQLALVEMMVRNRWEELLEGPTADPIHLFIKPEPHKKAKIEKKAYRLISSVSLIDTIVDRILYGEWLDEVIKRWIETPSKAGWSPQQGGYRWMAKAFRGLEPVSIDKSSWDWTVNSWHVDFLERLLPRMVFGRTEDWNIVFKNRMTATFRAGYPVFKTQCGCTFEQLVDGIMKSGMLATIILNTICQYGTHIAAGGSSKTLLMAIGDDTVQDGRYVTSEYIERLRKTGAIIKEQDWGWPIKFAGHEITENSCVPAYRAKHMFCLKYLDPKLAFETMESYRHLYALDDEVSVFLEKQALALFGPEDLLSREYLREWYESYENNGPCFRKILSVLYYILWM